VLHGGAAGPYSCVCMRRVIERLLNLLAFLLTAERPVTAEEIRRTVAGYSKESDEAFHRMFERDKALLRRMGIPIELHATDAWEVEFGYQLQPDAYQLPDPDLSDDERAALWLAAQVVRLGGQPTGPDALLKLGGLAMSGGGEPLAAELGMGTDDLEIAFQAATERRELRFRYHDRVRTVQPLGLLHQRGHWYLIGLELGSQRSYRMDKAAEIAMGEETGAFERPDGFDLKDAVPVEPWAIGEADVVARVVFDADAAWWARRQLGGQVEEHPDGSLEATVQVANVDAFIGWMLGFEDKAEIVAPEKLRQALIERVES
jgi:predicted DNA-binding transcriptional regulator YafY